jgi:hypothetical protein
MNLNKPEEKKRRSARGAAYIEKKEKNIYTKYVCCALGED